MERDFGAYVLARCRAARRGRYVTAVALAAVLAALVGLGLVTGRPPHPPVDTGSAPALPDWPRRGPGDAAKDDAAIAVWDAELTAHRVRRHGGPHVLWSGHDVVVLYGTTEVGGDRLVVVRNGAVYADAPAPGPHVHAVAVLLDPPRNGPSDMPRCLPRSAKARLLVLTEPGRTRAQWRPSVCQTDARWHGVHLHDGAALATITLRTNQQVELGKDIPAIQHPIAAEYDELLLRGAVRTDFSRATDLAHRIPGCVARWEQSLPDGTPVVLCASKQQVHVVAESRDRRTHVFADLPDGNVAVVVAGHERRWLVVAGPPDLRSATLVGRTSRAIPLTYGTGFLPLGEEPLTGTYVTTPAGRITVTDLGRGSLLWPDGDRF